MPQSTGHLYVIAAPSGAGKTSLVRALLASRPELRFSISYTTRKQRATEQPGRDYFFVDHDTFKGMVQAGEFLEHAQVFDNFYGTARAQVEGLLLQGSDVILEIDWQGARQIRTAMPACRTVFILPPSRAELARRLRSRGTDSEEVIQRRLRDAAEDISHWSEFEYVVVNDQFDQGLRDLAAIVSGKGEALRAIRPELRPLIADLLAGDP